MIRRGDYHYGRRAFGANNKFGPLLGHAPASTVMPPMQNNIPPVNTSSVHNESLVKGSGLYSKVPQTKTENSAPPPVPSKLVEPVTKEEVIVIHVCDEKKKVEKDFKCK